MTAPQWTEAHRREARARLYEIAAERVRTTGRESSSYSMREEAGFRYALEREFEFDPARIEREVRRVRGLAEGRLVRESRVESRSTCTECDGTGYVADEEEGDCPECEQVVPVTCPKCNGVKTKRVRVTRIRRATP